MALQQYPKLDGEDLYGKVVYLLGSAELGVKNRPTLIEHEYDLLRIFGTKGTLIDGYRQVKEGSDSARVYLCKVTGEHAVAKMNVNIPGQEEVAYGGLAFYSVYANEKYNDIKITVTSDYIMFTFPSALATPGAIYRYADHPTLFHLTNAINRDTKEGRNHVFGQCFSNVNTPTISAIHTVNPIESYMYGGTSGLSYNKNQLYHALDFAYALLESDDIDRIVPLDAFIDDMTVDVSTGLMEPEAEYLTLQDGDGHLSFYEQLLKFCMAQMKFGLITRGVMGYKTTDDKYLEDDFEGYIYYTKYFFNSNIIRSSKLSDYFGLIDVCIGDVYYDYGAMLGNHYTAYAGLCSVIPLKEHSTNKSYGKSIILRNEFDNGHLVDLMENSLVGVRVSPLTDLVTVMNGVTSAPADSVFHQVCNINMVQVTAYYVQRIFNKYLGEDLKGLLQKNTLVSELEETLKYLKAKGMIDQYKAQITDDVNSGKVKYLIQLKSRNMVNYIGLSNSINYIKGDA